MTPERRTPESEDENDLLKFREEIARFADEAYSAKLVENDPEKYRPYDATVVLLHDKIRELGKGEMSVWTKFKDFLLSINKDNFEKKKADVSLFRASIIRARNRYSDGLSMEASASNDSPKNKTRHEFYGWIINLFAGLDLMEDYDSYSDYETEVLADLRKRLHLTVSPLDG